MGQDSSAPNKKWTFQNYQYWEILWNLDGKIRHSFNNRILSILSAFLWEIEALLLPKKNFLLKYPSHKYKMRNKGSEIPLFTKKYQIFYCLKFVWVAARFVPCFGTPSFSPKMPNIGCWESFCSTIAFLTSTILKLSVLSLWTRRTTKWLSRQSEVVERRYVFTHFMAENHRSPTDKENFCQHNDLGYKSLRCCT